MPERYVEGRTTEGSTQRRKGSAALQLSLPEATSLLLTMTSQRAVPSLHAARKEGDPNVKDRVARISLVSRQLRTLSNFWDGIEGSPSTSLQEAFQRHETQMALLVHPKVAEVMRSAVTRIDLPDDAIVSVVGSSANGGAQIRTLAGTDTGLNQYRIAAANPHPDVDTILFSRAPIDATVRRASREKLDGLLTKNHLQPDETYNIEKFGYTMEEARNIDHFQLYWTVPHLFVAFQPSYPEDKATQFRWDIINMLLELRQNDRALHKEVLSKMKQERIKRLELKSKYFGDTASEIDKLSIVGKYFRRRISEVFFDLLDHTFVAPH